jgi:hypothetical protein
MPRRSGKLKRLTKRVVEKPDGRYLIYYETLPSVPSPLPGRVSRPDLRPWRGGKA